MDPSHRAGSSSSGRFLDRAGKPIVEGPDPDESSSIFNDTVYVERNTRFYTYKLSALPCGIDTEQRKACSNPEISMTVFIKTADLSSFLL